jgi:hypothetical protein
MYIYTYIWQYVFGGDEDSQMHYVLKHFKMQFLNTKQHRRHATLTRRKCREPTSETHQPRRAGVTELLAPRHNRLDPIPLELS